MGCMGASWGGGDPRRRLRAGEYDNPRTAATSSIRSAYFSANSATSSDNDGSTGGQGFPPLIAAWQKPCARCARANRCLTSDRLASCTQERTTWGGRAPIGGPPGPIVDSSPTGGRGGG